MNGTNRITEQQAIDARKKYVMAFNDTMLQIWQEKITMLNVIDTGALLASPKALACFAQSSACTCRRQIL